MPGSIGIQVSFDAGLKTLMYHRKIHPVYIEFEGNRSVKDVIESMGIPHVEVDVILSNGEPVPFSYVVGNGDRIEVFGDGTGMNVPRTLRLRFFSAADDRFVCDDHLWKLARRLRLLGLDVAYHRRISNNVLAEISRNEDRILLSRDRHVLMIRHVQRGILLRSNDCDMQVKEVLSRIRGICLDPFSRCLACNGFLENLDTGTESFNMAKEKIPPKVLTWCREFKICRSCLRIFWKGSHFKKLAAMVKKFYAGDVANPPEWGIMTDDD